MATMKRVKGGTKIVRGSILPNTYQNVYNKIQLFDGKFTTGYRVVRFEVALERPPTAAEFVAKLSTEPKSTIDTWDWSDVQEIAWARWNAPATGNPGYQVIIDNENMIVEDLWISNYSGHESYEIQYLIELEKYEFTAWDGAATMVKNNAQAGPGT